MNIPANIVDPQRWNRYAYVINNPLRFVDPSGTDQEGSESLLVAGGGRFAEFASSFIDWSDGLIETWGRDRASELSCEGRGEEADWVLLQTTRDVFAVMQAIDDRDAPARAAARDAAFHAEVDKYLAASGLSSLIDEMHWESGGYEGVFSDPAAAYNLLVNDKRFGNGPFGVVHDVGPKAVDFRSSRGRLGVGSHSLQVTFSRQTGRVHIDVDKFNPYDGGLFLLFHIFGEVIPNSMGLNK